MRNVVAGYDVTICYSCTSGNLASPATFIWNIKQDAPICTNEIDDADTQPSMAPATLLYSAGGSTVLINGW
jgi:hypothetical protein